MDFLHRNANNQPQAATRPTSGQNTSASTAASRSNEDLKKVIHHHEPRWLRIVFVVLLFSVTILALAIAILLYFGKDKEAKFVDESKQQAVFLTNGQVYFGKIVGVTSDYVDLQAIYYLNSQQQPESTKSTEQQTSFSLVKLGCELHGPSDQMVINRDQVSFWENLSDNGKVAKAIKQWQDQNPNGQTCSDSSSQNSTQQSQTPSTESKQQ